MLTSFIIGLFIGVTLGVLIMSLMTISTRSGRRAEQPKPVLPRFIDCDCGSVALVEDDQQGDWLREWLEEDERESFYNVEDMIAFLNAPSAGDRTVAIRRLRDAD